MRKYGTIQLIGVYGTAADNSQLDLIFNRNVQVKSGQAPVIHMMPNLYDMIKIKSLIQQKLSLILLSLIHI